MEGVRHAWRMVMIVEQIKTMVLHAHRYSERAMEVPSRLGN